MLIQPKDVVINGVTYRIGKIPYMDGGREVCTQFIATGIPKVGDYGRNEELVLKMMKHVAVVKDDGTELRLITKDLVNNHVADFQTGMQLEKEALEHNLGFSLPGMVERTVSAFREALSPYLSQIATQLQDSLSQAKKPR